MSDGIFGALDNIGVQVSNAIWDTMIKWFYETQILYKLCGL